MVYYNLDELKYDDFNIIRFLMECRKTIQDNPKSEIEVKSRLDSYIKRKGRIIIESNMPHDLKNHRQFNVKQKKEYEIFISYRRLDEQGKISGRDQARLIAKQLEIEGYYPFFDYSEIKDNEFDKVIIPAVENCKIFILVLSKDALNRCKNEGDWVRKEIETAIKSRCKIINVSPDNAFNGWPSSLPKSLTGITNIQISDIHFGSLFESSIKKLIDDRIAPTISKHDSPRSTNSILSQFNYLTNNLYSLTIKYRDSINQGEKVDNDYFMNIQDLVKEVHSISEISRIHDTRLFEKSKSIVDKYNLFVESLRKQFTSERESEDYNCYAAKSSIAFTSFVDTIVEAMDITTE